MEAPAQGQVIDGFLDAAQQARMDRITDAPEPGVAQPREQLVWQFAQQARASGAMGSVLYPHLLMNAIDDLEAGGPSWRLVRDHVRPGRGNAIALRLMAAVHRRVLTGHAPQLAPFFPSVNGTGDPTAAWPEFHAVLVAQEKDLAPLISLGCQTNESGRSSSLILGLLDVAARFGLPIDLIEIGCAAGLNLALDRFHYSGGGQAWGDSSSPVDLDGFWTDVPSLPDTTLTILSRTGVDRAPIDPSTEEGRLALMSSVWADQTERFEILSGALRLREHVEVTTVAADGVDWIEANLRPRPGRATVLMQSIVLEYLDPAQQQRLHAAVAAAGQQASEEAPLAWVALEPISLVRRHGLTVTTWPDGTAQQLVTSGSLGRDVRRSTSTSTAT